MIGTLLIIVEAENAKSDRSLCSPKWYRHQTVKAGDRGFDSHHGIIKEETHGVPAVSLFFLWYTTIMTGQEILDLPMDPDSNDARADSIRTYLKALLTTLMKKGEGFSGKRPFGNSGWEYDMCIPLIKAGLVEGKLDGDGYIDSFNEDAAVQLIYKAINAL